MVVALLFVSCGDPIEVGNASDKQQLEDDRILEALATGLAGDWTKSIDVRELLPNPPNLPDLALVVEFRIKFTHRTETRSGDYLPDCVGALCDEYLPPDPAHPADRITIRQLLKEGTYTFASVNADGSAHANLVSDDGGVALVRFSPAEQRLVMPFFGSEIEFARDSSSEPR